jgi:signal transduction histidine kinase
MHAISNIHADICCVRPAQVDNKGDTAAMQQVVRALEAWKEERNKYQISTSFKGDAHSKQLVKEANMMQMRPVHVTMMQQHSGLHAELPLDTEEM